ncbi:hypothetical protein Ga0080559_TMP2516 [Salipiger profundus]|uniref:Uncharacterized protein n=1 Tax=Salipiger profundus TaxID=1229727 RepID=A0A1U7D5C2_9RHOB|nr:hypothetical protein Ga0080559_TMP2516 [Salipiger profundus]
MFLTYVLHGGSRAGSFSRRPARPQVTGEHLLLPAARDDAKHRSVPRKERRGGCPEDRGTGPGS